MVITPTSALICGSYISMGPRVITGTVAFEGTLQRQKLEDANGIPLFIVGLAPDGQMVMGVRFSRSTGGESPSGHHR